MQRININKDYTDIQLDSQYISALSALYEKRFISLKTFMYNLQKGEIYPDNFSFEDEIKLLKEINNENAEEGTNNENNDN